MGYERARPSRTIDETLIAQDIRDVARLFLEVTLGGGKDKLPDAPLDEIDVRALVPGPAGSTINRAIGGEFAGATEARRFLEALT